MTQAALHPDVKVAVAGVKFFLGADKEREDNFEDSSDDEDGFDMGAMKHKMNINKKTSKRGRKLEQAVKTMKKKNSAKHSATYLNFSAIHLLRDPQGFAESLFVSLSSSLAKRLDLDQKIMFMNLISRLVGTHKLTVLGIYSYLLKYLTPKQRNVTQIMAASAQAAHDLVPPESIMIIVRKIADEFVSDGVAAEVASAGINTIREVCARAPLAIDADLLQDLTEYKGSKSKAVVMAARSLISLYREVAPEMLLRKDRGKTASMEIQLGDKKQLQFGVEASTVTGIPGLDLLAKWRKEQGEAGEKAEDWEVDSDDEDDVEGEWVTVDSDKEIDISDDEKDDNEAEVAEPEVAEAVDGAVSDLELSDDDEDETEDQPPKKKTKIEDKQQQDKELKQQQEKEFADLLTSRILTPADFAKLEELRTEAGVNKILGHNEDSVDSTTLVGKVKYKQLREERIAHAKEGKEDREKFGSRKGKREGGHSTTNKEKARKKNFVMMIHKKSVQGKQKLSLRERQKVLRAHIDKQKKKGH